MNDHSKSTGSSASASPGDDRSGGIGRRVFLGALVTIFGATNVFLVGKRMGWWKPSQDVEVPGPFVHGKTVPLREAEGDARFVQLREMSISDAHSGLVKLSLRFQFVGEPEPQPPVWLNVVLFNRDGNKISDKALLCKDHRPQAREPQKLGRRIRYSMPENSETVKIAGPSGGVEGISRVKLSIQRA